VAELKFDREPAGVPYDAIGQLTEWRIVDTVPGPVDGERFPAREFVAGGYRAVDASSLFLGLKGISAHLVLMPDTQALAGRQALMYRGQGGPTASEYWAWGFELERSGSTYTVYATHQDQLGGIVEQTIGAFTTTAEWFALAISRETDGDEFRARAWLDGDPIGEVSTVTSTTATPGQLVSLGCRVIAAGTCERIYRGRIERVIVNGEAATDAQVRFEFAALRGAYPDAYATWASYLPASLDRSPTSAYGRYKVRMMAEIRSLFDAAAARYEDAALPPDAYGAQLAKFEAALGLTPSATATIDERQASTSAALGGIQDLSPASLQALAAALFGVPVGGVAILEGANRFDIPVVGAGELTGAPWTVRGPATVTNEVGGLSIVATAGRDLRYHPLGDRAVFVDLYSAHNRPDARESDHGLSAIFDQAAGIQEDTWTGLALVQPDGAVYWLALDSGGVVVREYDLITGLSGRTVLDGAAVAPLEMVIEWIPETLPSSPVGAAGRWDGRWRTPGTGPGGWTTYSFVDDPVGEVARIGISLASALPATNLDLAILVTEAQYKAGDSPAWAYWQAFDQDPVNRDQVAHSAELDRKGRAVSRGSATYEDALVCNTDGAAWDFTPTRLVGARVGHVGDTASDAAQSTSVYPSSLWTCQEAAAPVRDKVGAVDLAEVAPAPTYQAAGPVRSAIEFAANTNALQAAATSSLDVSGNAVFLGLVVRVSGDGVILGKEQTASIGWVLSRSGGALLLRASDGVTTATATLSDLSSGFQLNTWLALTLLIKDDAGTARVYLADSQASAQASAVLTTSNTGLFRFGAGQSGTASPYRLRWAMAADGGEADALGLSDVAKSAAQLAAAAGVA
jgi:hypothetical protein